MRYVCDEAVQIASLHPSAHLGKFFGGGIEVRPCEVFEVNSPLGDASGKPV